MLSLEWIANTLQEIARFYGFMFFGLLNNFFYCEPIESNWVSLKFKTNTEKISFSRN